MGSPPHFVCLREWELKKDGFWSCKEVRGLFSSSVKMSCMMVGMWEPRCAIQTHLWQVNLLIRSLIHSSVPPVVCLFMLAVIHLQSLSQSSHCSFIHIPQPPLQRLHPRPPHPSLTAGGSHLISRSVTLGGQPVDTLKAEASPRVKLLAFFCSSFRFNSLWHQRARAVK